VPQKTLKFWTLLLCLSAWPIIFYGKPGKTESAVPFDAGKDASADRPKRGYHIFSDRSFSSPDKSFHIEQYANRDWNWQIWVYPFSGGHGYILSRPSDHSAFSATFKLSPDGKWLLREQKLSPEAFTVYLYGREGATAFVPATENCLGEMAWDFYAKKLGVGTAQIPTYNQSVKFVDWRKEKRLILSLSGLHFLDGTQCWVTDEWRCIFDLQKKEFELPPGYEEWNATRIYLKS
jgi:hypothetical protein